MNTKITQFRAVLCNPSHPDTHKHLFELCSHTPSTSLPNTDKTSCALYLTRCNSRTCDLQMPVNWTAFIYSRRKAGTDGVTSPAHPDRTEYQPRSKTGFLIIINIVDEHIANAPSASQLRHNQCAVAQLPPCLPLLLQ